MFNKKQKEIGTLNKKCEKLKRELEDINFENKELKNKKRLELLKW